VTDSASGQVTANDIKVAGPWFEKYASRGIALAVPEVPMAARLELLDMAGKFDFFRAASFSSEEMTDVRESGLLSQVDLLAINFHEAASLAGCNVEGAPQEIIKWIADNLGCKFPHLKLSITNGSTGSWIINGGQVIFLAAPKVEVQSAAGAGDAHFSGILAGLAAGLSIAEAHWIGILAGALTVPPCGNLPQGTDSSCRQQSAIFSTKVTLCL
jgi:sugar/nucleoside kinase (ribokinase family)